jgi:hypothetical protein
MGKWRSSEKTVIGLSPFTAQVAAAIGMTFFIAVPTLEMRGVIKLAKTLARR